MGVGSFSAPLRAVFDRPFSLPISALCDPKRGSEVDEPVRRPEAIAPSGGGSFGTAARVFGIGYPQAIALFSPRAGRTSSEVIAALDNFIAAAHHNEAGRHARRQAIIDRMLATASKAEQATRKVVLALLAVFGT